MFIILLYVIGISILLPALNSICASSFSREGKHFDFIKYIPVKYRIQWYVKIIVSILFSFIGINIYTTIFFIIVRVPIIWALLLYITSFLIILLISSLGTLIDSIQPKLIWDDEINSLRENYNTFMLMGFALLLFFALVGGSYILYFKMKVYLPIVLICILLIIGIINVILDNIIAKNAAKNTIETEI